MKGVGNLGFGNGQPMGERDDWCKQKSDPTAIERSQAKKKAIQTAKNSGQATRVKASSSSFSGKAVPLTPYAEEKLNSAKIGVKENLPDQLQADLIELERKEYLERSRGGFQKLQLVNVVAMARNNPFLGELTEKNQERLKRKFQQRLEQRGSLQELQKFQRIVNGFEKPVNKNMVLSHLLTAGGDEEFNQIFNTIISSDDSKVAENRAKRALGEFTISDALTWSYPELSHGLERVVKFAEETPVLKEFTTQNKREFTKPLRQRLKNYEKKHPGELVEFSEIVSRTNSAKHILSFVATAKTEEDAHVVIELVIMQNSGDFVSTVLGKFDIDEYMNRLYHELQKKDPKPKLSEAFHNAGFSLPPLHLASFVIMNYSAVNPDFCEEMLKRIESGNIDITAMNKFAETYGNHKNTTSEGINSFLELMATYTLGKSDLPVSLQNVIDREIQAVEEPSEDEIDTLWKNLYFMFVDEQKENALKRMKKVKNPKVKKFTEALEQRFNEFKREFKVSPCWDLDNERTMDSRELFEKLIETHGVHQAFKEDLAFKESELRWQRRSLPSEDRWESLFREINNIPERKFNQVMNNFVKYLKTENYEKLYPQDLQRRIKAFCDAA